MNYFKSLFTRFLRVNLPIWIPIPGLGCGVLGIVFKRQNVNLGQVTATLLKSLEYRGYDSTGAIVLDENKKTILRKDVGAPSTLVRTLGIESLAGKIMCGQVRWATFGSVTRENAQPHEVRCKKHIFGAHNGNITNTTNLKEYLTKEGHHVVSDNDGEILVHMVEHHFHLELESAPSSRRECMRRAIIKAASLMEGSYAAVVVDPETEIAWAIKSGSSLYAGISPGIEAEGNNPFVLVSSDLTSILKFTKNLIQLFEDEFMEFSHDTYQVYGLREHSVKDSKGKKKTYQAGDCISAPITRSRLRIEDTSLQKPYEYFMHQEIAQSADSSAKLVDFLTGGNPVNQTLILSLKEFGKLAQFEQSLELLTATNDFTAQLQEFNQLTTQPWITPLRDLIHTKLPDLKRDLFHLPFSNRVFNSRLASILLDLAEEQKTIETKYFRLLSAKLLDTLAELREYKEFSEKAHNLAELIAGGVKTRGTVYTLACGTSYNASRTAALFFNDIAQTEIVPTLPGYYRGAYANALRSGDVLIGISQSGETKDLIDIFNDVIRSGVKVKRVTLVNNENSTLAQEKPDFYLPIKCGPEIAVPATKSYIHQVVLFYYLAILTGEKKGLDVEKYRDSLKKIPELISETLRTVETQAETAAEALYMEPSMHLLATRISPVAEEAALKIRETVLNHAQGYEASEFKHGPNTILGLNTVLGLEDTQKMLHAQNEMMTEALTLAETEGLSPSETRALLSAIGDHVTKHTKSFHLSAKAEIIFKKVILDRSPYQYLSKSYPLVYITGPEERDIRLTISQMNTHKIRGANTFVIAEPNEDLLKNATTAPSGFPNYRSVYISLPRTGETLLTTFSSMIACQVLALKMSVMKMNALDRLEIPLHGVHPDVPKNVSKSITVD